MLNKLKVLSALKSLNDEEIAYLTKVAVDSRNQVLAAPSTLRRSTTKKSVGKLPTIRTVEDILKLAGPKQAVAIKAFIKQGGDRAREELIDWCSNQILTARDDYFITHLICKAQNEWYQFARYDYARRHVEFDLFDALTPGYQMALKGQLKVKNLVIAILRSDDKVKEGIVEELTQAFLKELQDNNYPYDNFQEIYVRCLKAGPKDMLAYFKGIQRKESKKFVEERAKEAARYLMRMMDDYFKKVGTDVLLDIYSVEGILDEMAVFNDMDEEEFQDLYAIVKKYHLDSEVQRWMEKQ